MNVPFSTPTTATLLAAKFQNQPLISLVDVAGEYLGLTPSTAKRKARVNDLPFPVLRLSDSQKAPWLVKFEHFASTLNAHQPTHIAIGYACNVNAIEARQMAGFEFLGSFLLSSNTLSHCHLKFFRFLDSCYQSAFISLNFTCTFRLSFKKGFYHCVCPVPLFFQSCF